MSFTDIKTKKKVSLHSSQIIQEQDEFPVGHLYLFFFSDKAVPMSQKYRLFSRKNRYVMSICFNSIYQKLIVSALFSIFSFGRSHSECLKNIILKIIPTHLIA